ncbi:hypothetical protein H5410_005022 [Solanum commersonii]|uniref:Uncharacterized protein n=1 Tax=Solanum commersonii TaxID=4109 RepID=A0A9J6A6G5_SOLCO|nr:hypothetical protein H5410_005022 [Solanum commersonii]
MLLFPILSKVLSIDESGPNQEEVLTGWQQQSIQVQSGEMGQKSLLMKWLWRCNNDNGTQWKQVIIAKDREESHWHPKISSTPNGTAH